VILACLKGKDAEFEEAQEHANSYSWRCMHKAKNVIARDFCFL
jgi:hypothetical protein